MKCLKFLYRSVFPCGDGMVAIIDDREDVWGRVPNLIHVKPYMFFSGVSDIDAPPIARPERRPSSSSEQDADKGPAITSNSSGNNPETTEPDTRCNIEVPEAGDNLQTSETKTIPSEYTESDKESDSESSSSVDSSASSSSGVSSVNSTNGLSEEPPDSSSAQIDVHPSMIITAAASQNPKPEEKPVPATVLKPDVDPGCKEVKDSNCKETKRSGPHPSASRIRRLPSDIQDPDDFLVHLAVTLSKIHNMFYTDYDKTMNTDQQTVATSSHIHTPDLKEIIPRMRQSVLKECNILFTGVIPTNVPPERCPEWNTARAFGATIQSTLVGNVDQPTTHLIVGRVGTSKLHEARKMPGVKIVDCGWLWASAERWQRVDEALYPVKESKLPHKEEKHHQVQQNKQPSDNNRLERLMSTGSVSVPLISDEELVEMDKEVDAEMGDDDMDTDHSDSDNEDSNDRIIAGSRKRKLSESPQSLSTSSDVAKSSDDEDDDEFGALLEAQIS